MDDHLRELYQCCIFFPQRDGRQPAPVEQRTIDRARQRHPEECRRLDEQINRQLDQWRRKVRQRPVPFTCPPGESCGP